MAKRELIVLSLIIVLLCGCGSPPEETTTSSTSHPTTTTTTTTTTTRATTTTTSTTTTRTTTTSTTTTTRPEFYNASSSNIDGVALNANFINLFGEITADENCDGEPCGGAKIKMRIENLSGSGNESDKLAFVGVRLSNYEKVDRALNGSFTIVLSDGKSYRRSCSDKYDLFGYYLASANIFSVPAKGSWTNTMVFRVPRKSEPKYLILQLTDGRKYRYELKKT